MGHTTKLESIQALRGFAALCVFAFHAKIPLPLWSDEASAQLLYITNRGFLGVDVFFVISGFIMAWVGVLSARSNDSPLVFGVKRFFRVAPPYWIATAVSLYLLVTPNTSEDAFKSLFFIPLTGDNPPFYGYALLGVGWTLNYEMLFYALFCIALLFGWCALAALAASLCALTIGVPFFNGYGFDLSVTRQVGFAEPYFRMATNPLMLEFLLGIGCAAIYSKARGKTPKLVAGALLIIGAGALGWVMTWTNESGLHAAIPAAVLLLGAVLSEDSGLIKVPRFASWLGEVSFSMYLVHAAIVQLVQYKVPPPLGSVGTYGKLIFLLGLTLVVSHLWYRFIEMPSARFGAVLASHLNKLTTMRWPARQQRSSPSESAP